MEIEKKYLIKNLPNDLSCYPHVEIEQCYLCAIADSPIIRIRRRDDDYILTYKNRALPNDDTEEKLCVAQEIEVALDQVSYEHLKEKSDGKKICKTRFLIPYLQYTIELDIFHEDYDGFILAEVEFESIEESTNFKPPEWFGEDVSGDYHYTNSYLSSR